MAVRDLMMSYGVKAVYYRPAGSSDTYKKLDGLTSEASVAEDDPTSTEFEGLTVPRLGINYVYGNTILTLAWGQWDMSQVAEVTGWKYDEANGILRRPSSVPDVKLDILLEFNTGMWGWRMPNAQVVAKTDQAAVKTDLMVFSITATALADINDDTVNFLKNKPEDLPSISINTPSSEVTSTAGFTKITVTSEGAWTIASDESWATLNPTSGASAGEVDVTVTYLANTGVERMASIVATNTATGDKATFILIQAAD